MNRVIYQQSLLGSFKTELFDVIETIYKIASNFRIGIGSKSKILFCHPDNKDTLEALVYSTRMSLESRGIHTIYPYRIKTNSKLPAKLQSENGELEWTKDRFVSYSDGPACDMSGQEYREMCIYFGWASYKQESVWFELGGNTFNDMLDFYRNPICNKTPKRENDIQLADQLINKQTATVFKPRSI